MYGNFYERIKPFIENKDINKHFNFSSITDRPKRCKFENSFPNSKNTCKNCYFY